jgi:WD40 repeat protein
MKTSATLALCAGTALTSGLAIAGMPLDRSLPLDGTPYLVAYIDGGRTLAALCEDGALRHWDVQTGAVRRTVPTPLKVRRADLVPDSDLLAAVAPDGAVQVWNLQTATLASELPAVSARAQRVAIAGNSGLFATTHMPDRQSSANVLRVRNASGKEIFTAPAGLGGTSVLGFSPDGAVIVSGSWDADLRVWSARNGELLKLIDTLPVATFAISFSPDGKWLATGGVDRTIYLWNTKDWTLAKKLTGHPELISALAFSPDGRRLATGGFDAAAVANPVSLIVWDLASGKPLRTEKMPHSVRGLAFSPDSRQLASFAATDKFVRIWQSPE